MLVPQASGKNRQDIFITSKVDPEDYGKNVTQASELEGDRDRECRYIECDNDDSEPLEPKARR